MFHKIIEIMKTNYVTRLFKIFLLAGIFFTNTSFSQNKFDNQLNVIFETFTTKDFQLLVPILKPQEKKYLSKDVMTTIEVAAKQICLVPAPESYRIVETETIGDNERITVEYQYTNKARFHYFTFSPKGKLIGLEVVPTAPVCL